MSSYRLPKDYESIVLDVLSNPLSKIVSILPQTNINEMRKGILNLIEFFKSNGSKLGDNRFLIKLQDHPALSGQGTQLSIAGITNALTNGDNVITVTSNGYIIYPHDSIALDNESLSDFSVGNVVIAVDCGQYLEFYADGRCVKEIDILNPRSSPRQLTKLSRQAKDFPLIILDHYQKHVKYAQSTEHWDDRDKRILRCAPQKTEFIFHKDLWNWLEDHKTDFIVYGEAKKLSPDRTDIELVTIKGAKRYILEVKWLGKNANNTEYNEDRIEQGIKQIKQYLQRERQTLIAALVIYNGRAVGKYQSLAASAASFNEDWCELIRWGNEDVPERGKCLVLMLDSKSASTA